MLLRICKGRIPQYNKHPPKIPTDTLQQKQQQQLDSTTTTSTSNTDMVVGTSSSETNDTSTTGSTQIHMENLMVVGGLEIPSEILTIMSSSNNNNSDPKQQQKIKYTLLFIGDDTCRSYLNIVLRFLSSPSPPQYYWTWLPPTSTDTLQYVHSTESNGTCTPSSSSSTNSHSHHSYCHV